MVDTEYDVRADLTLEAGRARSEARRTTDQIRQLGRQIRGSNNFATQLTRNLVVMGGAYLGLRVGARVFAGLTRSAFTYQDQLERTNISLNTVLQAVEGGTYEQAARKGGEIFQQLRRDSIKSVGTTMQMFDIFQAVVGPIRAAGAGLEVARKVTNDTVAAASVLGVDFEQARRDVQLMVQGTAGMDTRLFALLRSTGAIAEDTAEWNKNLTAQQRIEKLQAALGKFAPAAGRFARSWAGVTSTFEDVRNELSAAAAAPIFRVLTRRMEEVNELLLDNEQAIRLRLDAFGSAVAHKVNRIFGQLIDGMRFVGRNWDQILERAEEVAEQMRRLAPVLGKAALITGGAQLARMPVGLGVEAAAGAAGLVGMLAGSTGGAAPAAAAATAGTGATAAAGVGAGGLVAGLGILAGAVVAAGAAAAVAVEYWDQFSAIFDTIGGLVRGTMSDLWVAAQNLWVAVKPLVILIGTVVALGAGAIITALVVQLRLMAKGLRAITDFFAQAAGDAWSYWRPRFEAFWEAIRGFVDWLGFGVDAIEQETGRVRRMAHRGMAPAEVRAEQMAAAQMQGRALAYAQGGFDVGAVGGVGGTTPQQRATVVNDFRGSKITIQQQFKEADPDRVLVAMTDALTRQAEMRIQSGLVPALTR